MTIGKCMGLLETMDNSWHMFRHGMTYIDIGSELGKLLHHVHDYALNVGGYDNVTGIGIEIDELRKYGGTVLSIDHRKHLTSERLPAPRVGVVQGSIREVGSLQGFDLVLAFDKAFGDETMYSIGDLFRTSDTVKYFVSSRTENELKGRHKFTNIDPIMVTLDEQSPSDNDEDNNNGVSLDLTGGGGKVKGKFTVAMSGSGQIITMYGYRVFHSSSSSNNAKVRSSLY